MNLLSLFNPKKAGEEAFRLFCTPLPTTLPPLPEVFQNAELLSFNSDKNKITGYRVNKGGSRKILLLHGFSSSCRNFARYVDPLVAAGCEVLAFDAPAHGLSEGKTANAVEYKNMIIQVNNLYGPFNGYIAHSFGGIAVSLALEEIKHTNQTRVVLIAPATETTTAIDGAFAVLSLRNKKIRQQMEKIIFDISGKSVEWFSIRRAVKNIRAKILWIHDEDDDVTPLSDAIKVKEDNHQNISFIITRQLGHRRIYKDPAVVKTVVNFLQTP